MADSITALLAEIQQQRPLEGFRWLVAAIAGGFMVLEYGLARLALHDETHDLAETVASFGIALGNAALRAVEAGALALPFVLVYRYRLFDIPLDRAWAIVALFLGTEFFYYWHHRAAHRIRWMWATHAVHHSPTRLNYTAGIRLGWTGAISGNFLFFLPLVWIGFHPLAVLGMLGVNLGYQFFIHTQLAPHLGPLEWVLNTPRHHQVHHAANTACIDRNFGGVLIVFDRMFGTFTERPEGEALRYGLGEQLVSHNPIRIAFSEWMKIARDVWRASGWRERLRAMFGTP
jgi:sterol desaturase/sphingolipid hydroxylase (fatty acid hydroxylase superfamily)